MRIPESHNRTAIIGATGSGKTHVAVWLLSMQDIDQRPWMVLNWKRERLIDGIPYAVPTPLDEIPTKPGVYIYHPMPGDEEAVESLMWEAWQREGIGLYVDEGYMVGNNNPAFRALLTQGRSKQIPLMVLSQRPVWMDRFVFSESEFFYVFRIQNRKDRKAVQEFIPKNIDARLPEFHSYYYDVSRDDFKVLKPVPSLDIIYETFRRKLATTRKTA